LGELGYQVGQAPSVAAVRGGRLVTLDGHPAHAVRIRAQDGRLLMNVARLPPLGESDPEADRAAEVDACPLYDAVEQGLVSRGVGLRVFRSDEPGQAPVAAARSSDGLVARAGQQARHTRSPRRAHKPSAQERPLP
jgi:hypothetical protein